MLRATVVAFGMGIFFYRDVMYCIFMWTYISHTPRLWSFSVLICTVPINLLPIPFSLEIFPKTMRLQYLIRYCRREHMRMHGFLFFKNIIIIIILIHGCFPIFTAWLVWMIKMFCLFVCFLFPEPDYSFLLCKSGFDEWAGARPCTEMSAVHCAVLLTERNVVSLT